MSEQARDGRDVGPGIEQLARHRSFQVVRPNRVDSSLARAPRERVDEGLHGHAVVAHAVRTARFANEPYEQCAGLRPSSRSPVAQRIERAVRDVDRALLTSFAELVARVRALLRRSPPRDAATLSVDDLVVDLDLRRVSRRGLPKELTTRELNLLVYLVRHRNQIVSREMLARDVWQETTRVTSLDNVIDVH